MIIVIIVTWKILITTTLMIIVIIVALSCIGYVALNAAHNFLIDFCFEGTNSLAQF